MKKLSLIPALLISNSLWAQFCNAPQEPSAPDSRFQLDAGDTGVVIDLQTGLSWQRCSVGLEIDDANTSILSDDSCVLVDQNPQDGVADNNDSDFNNDVELTYSWHDALEYAEMLGNGWRMPNLKELSSLVEYACFSPAINSHVFPNAAQADYWSSTPNATDDSAAWTVNFTVGADDGEVTKNSSGYLLLVRD